METTKETIDMTQNADGTYEADAKTAEQNKQEPPKAKTIADRFTGTVNWVKKHPLKAFTIGATTVGLLYLGHAGFKAIKAAISTPKAEPAPVNLAATPLVNSIPDSMDQVEDTLLGLAEVGTEVAEQQAAAVDSVQAIKDAAESMGMTVEKIETL